MGVDVKDGRGLTSRCGRQRGVGVSRVVVDVKGVGVLTVGVDVKGEGVSRVNVGIKKKHMDTRAK